MPRKQRTKENVNSQDDTDSDSIPIKMNRTTVRRKTFLKERNQSKCYFENDYDADSEAELKYSPLKSTQARANSLKSKNCHMVNEQNVNKIMECSVKLTKILTPVNLSLSEYEDDQVTEQDECESVSCCEQKDTSGEELKNFMKKPKKKENVTPPDPHSTPSLLKLASRQLDDSLFGFNCLNTPLSFSPLIKDSDCQKSIQSPQVSESSFSPGKRKNESGDAGFFDLPIDIPRKRQKKRKLVKKENAEKDLETLRSQFEEVEMHELVIE